jgi:transposase
MKGNDLSAQFVRLKGRRGPKMANVAVAHSILVIAYHLLAHNESYRDLGEFYFQDRESQEHYKKRLVRQLERLGHRVILEPIAETA